MMHMLFVTVDWDVDALCQFCISLGQSLAVPCCGVKKHAMVHLIEETCNVTLQTPCLQQYLPWRLHLLQQ